MLNLSCQRITTLGAHRARHARCMATEPALTGVRRAGGRARQHGLGRSPAPGRRPAVSCRRLRRCCGPFWAQVETSRDFSVAYAGGDKVEDLALAAAEPRTCGRRRLSGELLILGADGRLSFDPLQQRLVTSPAKACAKAAELPASFAAFDLLAASWGRSAHPADQHRDLGRRRPLPVHA
jgi:hypothetical protein